MFTVPAETLEHGDQHRIVSGELAGQVVINTPTQTCPGNQYRPGVQIDALTFRQPPD